MKDQLAKALQHAAPPMLLEQLARREVNPDVWFGKYAEVVLGLLELTPRQSDVVKLRAALKSFVTTYDDLRRGHHIPGAWIERERFEHAREVLRG